jgi:hypothetical protein
MIDADVELKARKAIIAALDKKQYDKARLIMGPVKCSLLQEKGIGIVTQNIGLACEYCASSIPEFTWVKGGVLPKSTDAADHL